MALTEKLQNIGNAIREMTGDEYFYKLDEMPQRILSIQSEPPANELFRRIIRAEQLTLSAEQLADCLPLRPFAFYRDDYMRVITLPSDAVSTGMYAFSNMEALQTVNISQSLEELSIGAFNNCTKLVNVNFPDYSHLTKIDAWAFSGCSSLKTITIPAGVRELYGVFSYCDKLESITFKGTPTTMANGGGTPMFYKCNSLTDIYVPWSEGKVAGAPWGAEYATIHYNSEV